MDKILLVDDEQEVTDTLSRHLMLEEIKSVNFMSAAKALESHKKNLYPVVLTDIRMPGMSGVELLKQLKKIHPTCIVFIMTGFTSMNNLMECLELGAADYFAKPFQDIDMMVRSIKDALERSKRWKRDLLITHKAEGVGQYG